MTINFKQLVTLLREAVREEVKIAIREEFAKLDKTMIVERKQVRPQESVVKKQTTTKQKEIISEEQIAGNPMLSMIALTAKEMQEDGSINTFGKDGDGGFMGRSILDFKDEMKAGSKPQQTEDGWEVLGNKVLSTNDVASTAPIVPDMDSNSYAEAEEYDNPILNNIMSGKMAKILQSSYQHDGSHAPTGG